MTSTRFSRDPGGSRIGLTRLGSTMGSSGAVRESTSRPFLYRSMGAGMGTTYFLEKQAIVIDFGRSHTKVGFATESRPRHIIATPELRERHRAGPGLSCSLSVDDWVEILDKLLTMIFFHYLSVSPKDRRVVVSDSVLSSVSFRRAVVNVLFKRYSIPSVALVTDLVLPLYLTGLNAGIVIDLGYESTRILATFAGVPILSAYGATACAGHLINARLRKRLKQELLTAGQATDWLDDDGLIEDLKCRTCYVACNFPRGDNAWTMQTGQQATFSIQQRETIHISGETRWRPIEVLFGGPEDDDPDEDFCESLAPNRLGDWSRSNLSVPELFREVLHKCPIDVRAVLLQNVIVCGGCAMLRGLLPRLAVELRTKLQKDPDTTKIAERLRFTPLDFAPVCAVWTGGAIFGALEGNSDYTAEDFAEGTPIPDWARENFV